MNGMDATDTPAAATAERTTATQGKAAMQSSDDAQPALAIPASPDPLSTTDRYRLATPYTRKA